MFTCICAGLIFVGDVLGFGGLQGERFVESVLFPQIVIVTAPNILHGVPY